MEGQVGRRGSLPIRDPPHRVTPVPCFFECCAPPPPPPQSSFSCPDDSFCMKFTLEEVAKLPVFSLTLYGDTTLEMSPLRYLDRDRRGYYTPRYRLAGPAKVLP